MSKQVNVCITYNMQDGHCDAENVTAYDKMKEKGGIKM